MRKFITICSGLLILSFNSFASEKDSLKPFIMEIGISGGLVHSYVTKLNTAVNAVPGTQIPYRLQFAVNFNHNINKKSLKRFYPSIGARMFYFYFEYLEKSQTAKYYSPKSASGLTDTTHNSLEGLTLGTPFRLNLQLPLGKSVRMQSGIGIYPSFEVSTLFPIIFGEIYSGFNFREKIILTAVCMPSITNFPLGFSRHSQFRMVNYSLDIRFILNRPRRYGKIMRPHIMP